MAESYLQLLTPLVSGYDARVILHSCGNLD